MTTFQRIVKYLAMALAVFLTVSIIGGIISLLSMFGLISGFFSGDTLSESLKGYAVSSDIYRLEIDINAAGFSIKRGENFLVESNLKNLSVEDKNGTLFIKEKEKLFGTYTDALLTLYVPYDTSLERANVKTGAGKLTVEHLEAENMNFELGAGQVVMESLVASNAVNISGGAGSITISDSSLHNLNLDMGVGLLNLTSSLTGDCKLDLGVGRSNITVIGVREDYKLDIEKGIGSIILDGAEISELKEQKSSPNSIDISGGIGEVNLKFQTP